MSTKLLFGLLLSAALIAPGAALADPPDLCGEDEDPTPGAANQHLKLKYGPPGQNDYMPEEGVFLPANEYVAHRNSVRKETCPPPGHNKPD